MKTFSRLLIAAATLGLSLPAFALPVIDHDPISSAQPGKSLSILARVTAPGSAVKAVHLYYTPSSDASAIKVPMKSATSGSWYAVIPSRYTNGSKVYYYIHAEDSTGATAETEWSLVGLSSTAAQPVGAPAESVAHSRWFWPTVVVGGGALAIGGALALSDSGGSGGGDGGHGKTGTCDGHSHDGKFG